MVLGSIYFLHAIPQKSPSFYYYGNHPNMAAYILARQDDTILYKHIRPVTFAVFYCLEAIAVPACTSIYFKGRYYAGHEYKEMESWGPL